MSYEKKEASHHEASDNIQNLLDGIIDSDFITKQTGIEDLSKIIHLQLVIDTSCQSVFDLPKLVPNIQHLELDNSTIITVRDLGIGLRNITFLSLSTCGLNDLDGIGVLTGLQELNLSNNFISDVTPLAMHENIQNLNLSGNKVSEISIADALSSCPKLRSVFLSKNPICRARNYRSIIASLIGSLEMLDGVPVDTAAANRVTNGMILEAAEELKVVEEELDDEMRLENEIMGLDITSSAVNTNNTPGSPIKESNRTSIARIHAPDSELIPDTGSDLTHGSGVVLAGNMAAAVRRRRHQLGNSTDSTMSSLQNKSSTMASNDMSTKSKDNKKEFESALDVLDAALHESNTSKGDIMNLYKEGDVTEALSGGNMLFTEKYPERPLTAMNTPSTELRLTSLESDEQHEENFLSLESGRSSSAKHGNFFGASPYETRPRSSMTARSPHIESGRSTTDRRGSSISAFSPRCVVPPRSNSSSSGISCTEDEFVPSSARRCVPQREDSFGSDDGWSKKAVAPSPRQHNSSRPQSAVSSPSISALQQRVAPRSSELASTFSAPFKIAVEKEEIGKPPPVSASLVESEELTSIDGIAAMKGGGMRGSDTYTGIAVDSRPRTSYGSTCSEPMKQYKKKHAADNDDVDATEVKLPPSKRLVCIESDDEDSDSDDVAISHADRHRLMAASAMSKRADSTTASMKHRRNILMQLRDTSNADVKEEAEHQHPTADPDSESTTVRDALNPMARSIRSRNHHSVDIESTDEIAAAMMKAKPTSLSNSSRAGMSLGFNLAGSLAAIDKWVHDMSSDEDDDDTEDEGDDEGDGLCLAKDGFGDLIADQDKSQLSKMLATASINDNMNISKDSASEVSSTYSTSKASAQSQSKKNKILSRDAIFNMCSSGGKPPSSRTDASSANSSDAEPLFEIDGDSDLKGFSDDDEPKSPSKKVDQQQSLEGAHWYNSPRKRPDYKAISILKERRGIPARAKTPLQFQLPTSLSNSVPLGAEDIFRGADEEYELQMDMEDESKSMKSKSVAQTSAADNEKVAIDSEKTSQVKKKKSKAAVPNLHKEEKEDVKMSFKVAINDNGTDTSPARYTEEDSNKEQMRKSKELVGSGRANRMTDEELIELLRQPPKSTLVLRTRGNFQDFFRGISNKRMLHLLTQAYGDIHDASERTAKINKRMEILKDVIV